MKKIKLLLTMLLDVRTGRWLVRWLEFHYRAHVTAVSRLQHVGEGTWIEPTVKFTNPQNISIGANCHINHLGCLQASEKSRITIGNDLRMGPGTMIYSSNHGIRKGRARPQSAHHRKGRLHRERRLARVERRGDRRGDHRRRRHHRCRRGRDQGYSALHDCRRRAGEAVEDAGVSRGR
jgi:hypothetical protein